MRKSKIHFNEIPIPKSYGMTLFRIFFVIDGQRSQVIEEFNKLDINSKNQIKDLICKMATIKEFKSVHIKYNLQNYNYGELRPFPHRLFFFQKCGNNFIFFQYKLKRKNSLGDEFYKDLNNKKAIYEKEFQNQYC